MTPPLVAPEYGPVSFFKLLGQIAAFIAFGFLGLAYWNQLAASDPVLAQRLRLGDKAYLQHGPILDKSGNFNSRDKKAMAEQLKNAGITFDPPPALKKLIDQNEYIHWERKGTAEIITSKQGNIGRGAIVTIQPHLKSNLAIKLNVICSFDPEQRPYLPLPVLSGPPVRHTIVCNGPF